MRLEFAEIWVFTKAKEYNLHTKKIFKAETWTLLIWQTDQVFRVSPQG